MNLIDKLLDDLDLRPLSKSLPPILRAAQKIEDNELEKWVRLELNGYYHDNNPGSDAIEVPDYRGVGGQWRDDFGNVLLLPEQDLSFLNEVNLRHATVELESFHDSTRELGLRDTGLSGILRENLHVEVTTFWFRSSSVTAVLSAIRTQASDRLMSRRSEINNLKSATPTVEADIIQLRPNFYGIGLDLRALWRHFRERG